MNSSPLITAGLALAACIRVNAAQVDAASPPPIQVVLEDKDPNSPIGLYRSLQVLCLAKQGLTDAEIDTRVKPLPKGVAERYLSTREEFLFDGPRQAIYRAFQGLAVDMNNASCDPKLIRGYSAEVAVGCELAASGAQGSPELIEGSLVTRPPVSRSGPPDGKTLTCRGGKPPLQVKLAGLPVLKVEGLPCLSLTDGMLRAGGGTPRTSYLEGSGEDVCVWADMPFYAGQQGRSVPVAVVDRHSPEEIAVRAAEGRDLGTPQFRNSLPVKFQVGAVIPASRFTPEAVRAFISQPTILTVDVDHAAMK